MWTCLECGWIVMNGSCLVCGAAHADEMIGCVKCGNRVTVLRGSYEFLSTCTVCGGLAVGGPGGKLAS